MVNKQFGTFTVSFPKDLKRRMDANSEVNWPKYIKNRLVIRLKELEKFKELKNKGKI